MSHLETSSPVVLVTGGAKRVGAAIVRKLHSAGCAVAIHCNASLNAANKLAESLEAVRANSACVLQADLLDTANLPALITDTVARFGRLDGLVNNASSFFPTALGSINETAWHDLIGSNLKAPLFLSQAAAPYLTASKGAMVNIIDIHADRPLEGYLVYSAAKSGLQGLTRSLAIELAPHVRVNGVAPGPIEWPEDGQFSTDQRNHIVRHTLLQRTGSGDEVASAVKFLLLEASYITGQVLAVDGGRSARL